MARQGSSPPLRRVQSALGLCRQPVTRAWWVSLYHSPPASVARSIRGARYFGTALKTTPRLWSPLVQTTNLERRTTSAYSDRPEQIHGPLQITPRFARSDVRVMMTLCLKTTLAHLRPKMYVDARIASGDAYLASYDAIYSGVKKCLKRYLDQEVVSRSCSSSWPVKKGILERLLGSSMLTTGPYATNSTNSRVVESFVVEKLARRSYTPSTPGALI